MLPINLTVYKNKAFLTTFLTQINPEHKEWTVNCPAGDLYIWPNNQCFPIFPFTFSLWGGG